jgi:hypothetical protein
MGFLLVHSDAFDIFSINKSRGYENPSLNIFVIERCSTGGCPLEEAHEHFFLIQSVIYVVVLISFHVLLWCIMLVILLLFCRLLAFYLCSAYFLYMVYYKWYHSTFLSRKCGKRDVSSVFKPQRSVVTHINSRLRDSYMQKIQVVLKHTSVGHPCNPCWYPFKW